MPDFSRLTERQREIYEFIRTKIESRGYGPTVREIGTHFGIKSPNGVMCHLKALENKGLIKRETFSARAIQLLDHHPQNASLPLKGLVAAGSPTEAIEQEERLEFGDMFTGPDRFALKVRGLSMIEDHIADGDYVVIQKKETAHNGERVVVQIDGEATLKYFYEEADHIRLEPANNTMRKC
jgi:repressor LexA